MKKAFDDDFEKIIKYLKANIYDCLYIYGDLYSFGLSYPNLDLWYQEVNGDIVSVLFRFFDGVHVCGDLEKADILEVITYIKNIDPKRILGKRTFIDKLKPFLLEYEECTYREIMRLDHYRKVESSEPIYSLSEENAGEVADFLIHPPDHMANYTKEVLETQLKDLVKRNSGVGYFIRKDGKIAAYNEITIECDLYGIATRKYVAPEYRKEGLYSMYLDSYTINNMLEKGKDVYGFMEDPRMIKLYKALHYETVAEACRLSKK